MKRYYRKIIILTITIFLFLLIWRVWPKNISDVLSLDKNSSTIISAQVLIRSFENKESYTDTYYFVDERIHSKDNILEDILDILTTSYYLQDYRNLLPGKLDCVAEAPDFEGYSVRLDFFRENEDSAYATLSFMSSSQMTVFIRENPGFHVYHPTDREVIYKLGNYIRMHGVAH